MIGDEARAIGGRKATYSLAKSQHGNIHTGGHSGIGPPTDDPGACEVSLAGSLQVCSLVRRLEGAGVSPPWTSAGAGEAGAKGSEGATEAPSTAASKWKSS